MLTTACATGVGVDMQISYLAPNPPYHNRMLKWFDAVFDATVCWLSDHLIDDAAFAPPFTGTPPYESQGAAQNTKKTSFKCSQGRFHISPLPGSNWSYLCVCPDYPSLRVDHRCTTPIQSKVLLFSPNIQKCVPGSHCRIFRSLLPYGSILQSSVSFTCSFLLIWLSGYTKHTIQNQYVQY